MNAQLTRWEPENPLFWEQEGHRIARRNLLLSVPALVLSFTVWMLWSAVAVALPHIGFEFTPNQLFWLVALPGLAGGTLRLLFAFVVPLFGGRTWTTISTALLVVPVIGIAITVRDPDTSYVVFLALALVAGLGGGNFASSMANLSFFYPLDRKGAALGLNAGLGNLGVGLAQFVVPLAVGAALFGDWAGAPQVWNDGASSYPVWLQNAGLVWVPLILLAAVAAWYGMDDIAAMRSSVADQAVIFVRKHNWILSWLYLGTFGSFIGFSAGFPLLAEVEFGTHDTLGYAFLGPLSAAAARVLGGWLADRHGGAKVALASFAAMALATAALFGAMPGGGGGGNYPLFVALFAVLFLASGLGNGAVFHMIPVVFVNERRRAGAADEHSQAAALREGTIEGAAGIGFASAIAAFGGFVIPKSLGTAVSLTGGAGLALAIFLAFYASCIAMTWWYYARRRAEFPC